MANHALPPGHHFVAESALIGVCTMPPPPHPTPGGCAPQCTCPGLDDHDLSATAEGFTLCPTLLHPRSRGSVTVVSADPFEHPKIDPNYLSDRRDVLTLIEGWVAGHQINVSLFS